MEAGAISQLNLPNRILLHDSGRGLGGGGGFLLGLDLDFNGDSDDLGDDEDISLYIYNNFLRFYVFRNDRFAFSSSDLCN